MKWFVHADGETAGPLTFDQMAELANEGLLLRDTDVAEVGSDVWTAASADAELSSLFKKHPRRDDWTGAVREDATKPKRFAKLVLPVIAFITLCVGALTIIFAVVAPGKEEHPATRAASRSSDFPQSAAVPVANAQVLQKQTTPLSSAEKACIAASVSKIPNSPGTTINASRAKGDVKKREYWVEIDARVAGQDVTYELFCGISDDGDVVVTPFRVK